MPNTMAMFTRTLETVGRSTTTAVGIPLINPSRTGRAQKITSNGKEANLISSDHLNRDHRKRAARIALLKAALIVPVAALIGPAAVAVEAVRAIWTGRLRTDRVAIFQVNGSKISNAVAAAVSGVTAVVEDLAGVTVLALADSAEVIDLAEVTLAAEAALADLVAGGADGKNKCLE
jgi:hypothetical protein